MPAQQCSNRARCSRADEADPEQFQVEHRQIADLNREMAEIENQNKDWLARWQKLQDDRSTDSTIRIEAIEDLTALLNRNHLDLIDESRPKGTTVASFPWPWSAWPRCSRTKSRR